MMHCYNHLIVHIGDRRTECAPRIRWRARKMVGRLGELSHLCQPSGEQYSHILFTTLSSLYVVLFICVNLFEIGPSVFGLVCWAQCWGTLHIRMSPWSCCKTEPFCLILLSLPRLLYQGRLSVRCSQMHALRVCCYSLGQVSLGEQAGTFHSPSKLLGLRIFCGIPLSIWGNWRCNFSMGSLSIRCKIFPCGRGYSVIVFTNQVSESHTWQPYDATG